MHTQAHKHSDKIPQHSHTQHTRAHTFTHTRTFTHIHTHTYAQDTQIAIVLLLAEQVKLEGVGPSYNHKH